MEVDTQSVVASVDISEDSDIEVTTCHQQVSLQPQGLVAGRLMTTDMSEFTDNEFSNFPWDDLESILQMTESQAYPLDRGRPWYSFTDQ